MNESCWIPTQKPKPDGYVQLTTKEKKHIYLHRWMYESIKGKIPNGKLLDHLCRERSCCNPNHLEPVSNQENCIRGLTGKYQTKKTHCPKNHPYDNLNTYIYKNMRFCKKCRTATQQKYKRRLQNV